MLAKSWLLALPQLLIAVVFAGIPFWIPRDMPWSLAAGGLLGDLTLVAMVILLFGARCPIPLALGLFRILHARSRAHHHDD